MMDLRGWLVPWPQEMGVGKRFVSGMAARGGGGEERMVGATVACWPPCCMAHVRGALLLSPLPLPHKCDHMLTSLTTRPQV
eukprot:355924-Chlamydomonas_euryale.AAC.1